MLHSIPSETVRGPVRFAQLLAVAARLGNVRLAGNYRFYEKTTGPLESGEKHLYPVMQRAVITAGPFQVRGPLVSGHLQRRLENYFLAWIGLAHGNGGSSYSQCEIRGSIISKS